MDIQSLDTAEFIRYAERQATACFYGIVTEQRDDMVDGVPVTVNTISKFNRTELMKEEQPQDDEPAGDCSVIRTGKPGSRERVEAYRTWNENNGEVSVFMGEDE